MNQLGYLSTIGALTVLLSACGGGGGTSATLAPFTRWSAVTPNKTIAVNGLSQSGTYSYDPASASITARDIGTASTGANITARYNGSGQLQQIVINPAGSTPVSFTRGVDSIGAFSGSTGIDAAVSADGKQYALAANPFAFGWDYQSFGIWTTGAGTGSGTFGSISVGAATPGSAIPTSGVGSYSGISGGRYVDSAGKYYFTASTMTAAANFASRSVNFATFNTQITPDLVTVSARPDLNLAGVLSYAAATNQIAGNVSTAGGLAGTANARFYGPAAQEIGGVFATASSTNLSGYSGAFGGKR